VALAERGTSEKETERTNGVPNLRERRWLFKYYQIRIRLRAELSDLPSIRARVRSKGSLSLSLSLSRRLNIEEIRSELGRARAYRSLGENLPSTCPFAEDGEEREINIIEESDIERYKQITRDSPEPR